MPWRCSEIDFIIHTSIYMYLVRNEVGRGALHTTHTHTHTSATNYLP